MIERTTRSREHARRRVIGPTPSRPDHQVGATPRGISRASRLESQRPTRAAACEGWRARGIPGGVHPLARPSSGPGAPRDATRPSSGPPADVADEGDHPRATRHVLPGPLHGATPAPGSGRGAPNERRRPLWRGPPARGARRVGRGAKAARARRAGGSDERTGPAKAATRRRAPELPSRGAPPRMSEIGRGGRRGGRSRGSPRRGSRAGRGSGRGRRRGRPRRARAAGAACRTPSQPGGRPRRRAGGRRRRRRAPGGRRAG